MAAHNHAPELILASASPRRRELLEQIGLVSQIIPADINESRLPNEKPDDYVLRLSMEKARAVAALHHELPVLAADTAVVLENQVFGKPADAADAHDMLTRMSGNSHEVLTGTAIVYNDIEEALLVRTVVRFRQLSETEITAYCQSGEPAGKAGSYAIQGLGALLVSNINGSYSNVVGLPLKETAQLLEKAGILLLSPGRYAESTER